MIVKKTYERLTLVKHNGHVYLSKQDVPVNTPPTGELDDGYWLDYEVKAYSSIIGIAFTRDKDKPAAPTGGSYIFGTDDHSTDNNILIANLSTNDISLERRGQISSIQSKSIDWFNVGGSEQVTNHVIINGDKPVNAIIYTMTSAKSTDIEAKRGIAPNDVIVSFAKVNLVVFARVVLIFNA